MRALLIVIACVAALAASPARSADIPADLDLDLGNLVVSKSELVCLALNDYWESRGEPLLGRIAVAQVVLNRARDSRYPNNICDVVKQRPAGRMSGCQFSWICERSNYHPQDGKAWREAVLLASAMLARDSAVVDPTNGAKWFHSVRIKPEWSERLSVVRVISGHVFYREPDAPARERVTPTNFADWKVERAKRRYQQVAEY